MFITTLAADLLASELHPLFPALLVFGTVALVLAIANILSANHRERTGNRLKPLPYVQIDCSCGKSYKTKDYAGTGVIVCPLCQAKHPVNPSEK